MSMSSDKSARTCPARWSLRWDTFPIFKRLSSFLRLHLRWALWSLGIMHNVSRKSYFLWTREVFLSARKLIVRQSPPLHPLTFQLSDCLSYCTRRSMLQCYVFNLACYTFRSVSGAPSQFDWKRSEWSLTWSPKKDFRPSTCSPCRNELN